MAKLKCDNCGHYNFRRFSDWAILMGTMFALFGFLIGVLWSPALSLLVIGIGILIGSWFYRRSKKDQYQCLNCKKTFSIIEAKKLKSL